MTPSSQVAVLAITKRTAELCATQTLLYGAGYELVTATNMSIARVVMKAKRVGGVIVCRHSWSDEERESIVSDLAEKYPDVTTVVRCPGCTGCDEAGHKPGTFCDALPFTQLMTAMAFYSKSQPS
jgi:hypothetical protein